jgi:hypothetical protein
MHVLIIMLLVASGSAEEQSSLMRRERAPLQPAGAEVLTTKELVDAIDTLVGAVGVLQKEMSKNPAALAQVDSKRVDNMVKSLATIINAASFSAQDSAGTASSAQGVVGTSMADISQHTKLQDGGKDDGKLRIQADARGSLIKASAALAALDAVAEGEPEVPAEGGTVVPGEPAQPAGPEVPAKKDRMEAGGGAAHESAGLELESQSALLEEEESDSDVRLLLTARSAGSSHPCDDDADCLVGYGTHKKNNKNKPTVWVSAKCSCNGPTGSRTCDYRGNDNNPCLDDKDCVVVYKGGKIPDNGNTGAPGIGVQKMTCSGGNCDYD